MVIENKKLKRNISFAHLTGGNTSMRYLPTGKWMQMADQYTINHIGIPSMVLMERAALKVVENMETENCNLEKVLVVCGSGNNGGDGFAIARLLKMKGFSSSVFFVGKEESMTPDCHSQRKIAENCGVPVVTVTPKDEYTTIVDAVFGVGLNRPVTGTYQEILKWMNSKICDKVAVDIPSGVCSTTGRELGIAFQADLTITFACEKLGMALYPGYALSGKIIVADIGIDSKFFADKDVTYTFEKKDLKDILPARKAESHKGSYGKVLMITGSKGMSGAAYLSAKAAYTAGTGLVQIYTVEENRVILQQLLPEAIITAYSAYDKEQIESLLEWADVVCIGCGLGQSELSEKILLTVLSEVKTPCVVDADGINLLSNHDEFLRKEETLLILTPHMKEMTGLLKCTIEELKEERFERISDYTKEHGLVCVLKDSRTMVCKRGESVFLNTAGNNAMAKAGSGDVLAGVIAGLLAQKKSTYEAAAGGVYLHACGGDEAKRLKGSYSVLANDLIEGIAACIKKTEES